MWQQFAVVISMDISMKRDGCSMLNHNMDDLICLEKNLLYLHSALLVVLDVYIVWLIIRCLHI